ncbi:hypothetical protein SAMN05443582_101518 [Phyllobacterium sp. OV277]|nr:hypothetical protein SAMN05443582_101518 [Phyllobacterium sp. OV277]
MDGLQGVKFCNMGDYRCSAPLSLPIRCTTIGSWFDKLTMRGLGGCNDNRKHSIANVAELDSLQSSPSLMVSLSNHEPPSCNAPL